MSARSFRPTASREQAIICLLGISGLASLLGFTAIVITSKIVTIGGEPLPVTPIVFLTGAASLSLNLILLLLCLGYLRTFGRHQWVKNGAVFAALFVVISVVTLIYAKQ